MDFQTLILLKPDCVRRELVAACLGRFERAGLSLTKLACFEVRDSVPILHEHYREHRDQPYFVALIDAMSMGPIYAGSLVGLNAVARARRIVGPYTDPPPGTIRGDWAESAMLNLVHSADSPEAACRETELWLPGEASLARG